MSSDDVKEDCGRPILDGSDVKVPLVDGTWRPYVNLDYAASAPALIKVVRSIDSFLPYYSSVHRGAGLKSQISTAVYEGARSSLRGFFRARPDDSVIFTRNTTDSINLLASSLRPGAAVVVFASEHHANLLPWQRGNHRVTYLPVPDTGADALEALDRHLRSEHADLVTFTGASNVTGEVWPVEELTRLAHSRGARALVDAAQLAPHAPISIADLDVDYLAASGHKLYAPYGAGVLIGKSDWLEQHDPYLRGGGAVDFVTTTEVLWTSLPDRQEAGSPNVIGAAAMGAAADALAGFGMQRISDVETALGDYARAMLLGIPGVEVYRLWESAAARIGVIPFNVRGYDHSQLAAILSAEYGIGVRHGCFCAHPLMVHMLKVDRAQSFSIRDAFKNGVRPNVPGAVRASLGLGTTRAEIDYFLESITSLAAHGPKWNYRQDSRTGDYYPVPDPRRWPELELNISLAHSSMSESS